MSTRATYFLPLRNSSQSICFYIHSDGYPEGAAYYLYNMHRCKNMQGGLACRFLRANANAEFTKNHETHIDTEFQYTINHQDILTVRQKNFDDEWCTIYKGPWYLFLNQYLSTAEHLYAFKFCSFSEGLHIMTIREAQRYIRAFLNNRKQKHYFHDNVEVVQAQIDDILKRSSNSDDSSALTWEKRFALFSVELENKIALWTEQKKSDPLCSEAEKLEEDFGLFFDNLIEAWAHGSGVLASATEAFAFRKASNAFYIRMVEEYGLKLLKMINSKTSCKDSVGSDVELDDK